MKIVLWTGLVVLVLGTAVPARAAEQLEYVALGDSAAAGPWIPLQVDAACRRSDHNYPAIAAKTLGARLTDVTCSGAVTADLTSPSKNAPAPQLDALSATTGLVSVTIGANDSGLFDRALSCVNALPEPVGVSCSDRIRAGGTDPIAASVDAWGPVFGAALDEIRRRAPKAKVLVTGYGTYLRPGGCHPVQPVWARDADYLQSTMDRISSTARELAGARGMRFVDFAAVSVGHDICAAPWDRYLEGLIPVNVAAPLHPNAKGMAAFAAAVATAAAANR
ncbi:SGNH/GDSL hydrolase family protein [Allokutzneria sp. A3M-2-11 16]|uniref:SGNH/GDSL hydrolase family protein n=1 Tax=Allokutzneria sp. A3M-2-11 16 TaxID=2962043 RepID=UPI0020B7839E|nr:SGNH/GDSL hydrolase family protein [Allokutzneria sp. A3M-2-11 16]MCP3803812.1 SGNH/GDSL hydrolase family protein [Allokutzneria sp. A3M-2-11 16]